MARRKVHANIMFSAACKTAAEVESELKKSPFLHNAATALPGSTGTQVLFVWDQTCAGEALSCPHLRNPPFQYATCNTFVTGALKARSTDPEDLTSTHHDVFLFADGGKPGLLTRFQKTLSDSPEKAGNKEMLKHKHVLNIGYEQGSLQARRRVRRGYLPQIEDILMVGTHIRNLPTKKRKFFAGASVDTKGTLLAPVKVQGYDDMWALPYNTKKGIFDTFRLKVGGPVDDEEEEGDEEVPPSIVELQEGTHRSKIKPRTSREEGDEPVFYQSLKSKELWMELIHTTSCQKAVVTFTAGDGSLLEACLAFQP